MVWNLGGGILGALHVLKDHWGPVGRDLACSGWAWTDVGERLPWQQFIQFVLYTGPGTAVFHRLHDGWDANTHKITDLIEWMKMSICARAENPEAAYKSLGQDARPGQVKAEPQEQMTIGQYMDLAGLSDN